MGADFEAVTPAHLDALARDMRAEDAAEVRAMGAEPLEALLTSVRHSSSAVAILAGGLLLGVGGYRLLPGPALAPRCAVAWLLTSEAVERHPIALHKATLRWLQALRVHADMVCNDVDARYARCLRWLRRLGFDVYPARPLGPAGALFHPVFRRL